MSSEFVVVVTPPSNAAVLLERLRQEWMANRPLPVTFSAGIATFAGDPTETLRAADAALYRAKATGRDRWAWGKPEPSAVREAGHWVEPYLDDAIIGNRRPAVRLVMDLLDGRVPAQALVEDLLAVAQREVGERWYRGELSPADEHLASGVVAASLDALAAERSPPTSDELVVVACAEGDWHSLSAQMFGEALGALGFKVTVLGASTPAAAVAEFLERVGGDVLAVSCNLPIFFPGAVSLIDAAHKIGVPVIAGGRALGGDDRRATRLGADGWAADATGAAPVLANWAERPPLVDRQPIEIDPVALRLHPQSRNLAAAALGDLCAAFPPMADYDARRLAHPEEDLGFIVQFLAASIMAGDDTVFSDFLDWLHELLLTRGVPTPALAAGLEALIPGVESVGPGATHLLTSGLRALRAPRDASKPPPVDLI